MLGPNFFGFRVGSGFDFRVRVGSGLTRETKVELGSGRVIFFRVGFSGFSGITKKFVTICHFFNIWVKFWGFFQLLWGKMFKMKHRMSEKLVKSQNKRWNFACVKPAGTCGVWLRVRVGSGFTREVKFAFGSGRVIFFRVGFSGFRVPEHDKARARMNEST